MVDAEAAVGVEAAIWVALEDFRLPTFTHLLDGVDGDCRQVRRHQVTSAPGVPLLFRPTAP